MKVEFLKCQIRHFLLKNFKEYKKRCKVGDFRKGIRKMELDRPLITVIIPVYNAEKYLKECLESVFSQTWPCLEVILVDDGSTDLSRQIIEKAQQEHSNVKAIMQKNGGVGRARNAGLDAAKGEYIAFCDSDDIMAPDMIETLYENMKHTGAELSCCQYTGFEDAKNIQFQYSSLRKVYDGDGRYQIVMEQPLYSGYVWNKLFTRHIIADNGLAFSETLAILEDKLFVLQYICKCKSLCITDAKLYAYRQSENSALKQKILPKGITSVLGKEQVYQNVCQYTTNKAIHAVAWNDMMHGFAISYKKLFFIRTEESFIWRCKIRKCFRNYVGQFTLDQTWNLKEHLYYLFLYLVSRKK